MPLPPPPISYDRADPENIEWTFESPTSGERVNAAAGSSLRPMKSSLPADARLRVGPAFPGLAGPVDHIASSMVGQMMGLPVFEKHSARRAGALQEYFPARPRYRCLHDLRDRVTGPEQNKSTGEHQDEFLATGVVDEDSEGITVRGAKMLGTGSIMANEVLFANIQPLKPGEEKYAISFAIPMNTKGLKIMSRRSYEESVVAMIIRCRRASTRTIP